MQLWTCRICFCKITPHIWDHVTEKWLLPGYIQWIPLHVFQSIYQCTISCSLQLMSTNHADTEVVLLAERVAKLLTTVFGVVYRHTD